MFFKRFSPAKDLENIIECYWIIEDDDTTPQQQKIIPDGFNELIFHYRSPYRIKLGGDWKEQSLTLLAGQIRKHFFLENTGASGIIGIKVKPTALTHLFGFSMHQFTDRVVDISSIPALRCLSIRKQLLAAADHDERMVILNGLLQKILSEKKYVRNAADHAIELIFANHGMMPVSAITQSVGIGERQLENLFKKYIGLSPKFFMRIIRFNYIFRLVLENNQSWSGLAYEASYFDQSHFIRNFRDFTGENPSDYAFDEKNMANFFLQKK
ncbi:MAG: helix-turn-helix domain-containing protein [Chitinophagaceae bacterium]